MRHILTTTILFCYINSTGQKLKETFLIPIGFQGRINVIFNQFYAAPIPIENGRRIYHIPADGILITSSKLKTGFFEQEYYYVDNTGGKIKIPIQEINIDTIPEIPTVVYSGAVGVYGNSSDAHPLNYIESIIASKSTSDSIYSQTSILKFERMIQKKVQRMF